MLSTNQNTGLKLPVKTGLEWMAGGETGIQYQENCSDWTPFESPYKDQRGKEETNFCVTFGHHRTVSTYMNWLIASSKMPNAHMRFLTENNYLVNGKIIFSELFSALTNGTGYDGNTQDQVASNAKINGLIPESMLPLDLTKTHVEIMSTQVTQAMRDMGKKFLQYFDLPYDFVTFEVYQMTDDVKNQLIYHVKQSPLSLAIPVCATWNSGIVMPCGLTVPTHVVHCKSVDEVEHIVDTYNPYEKILSKYYPVPYAQKIIVVPKDPAIPVIQKPTHTFNQDMKMGDSNGEVLWLQKCLQYLGLMGQGIFGPYGPKTQAAIRAFQAKYSVGNPVIRLFNNGKYVGPATRAALNKQFSI